MVKAEKFGGVRWSFAGMQVPTAGSSSHALSRLKPLQDVLGAMSPPPAPMFMPHGNALLDSSSDELQSSPAAVGASLDEVPSPIGPNRLYIFF
jgi:hypothetical protein